MSVIENPKAVLNQPPPLRGYNMYETNVPLVEAVRREGADWPQKRESSPYFIGLFAVRRERRKMAILRRIHVAQR